MPVEDKALALRVRREIAKRELEISLLDIKAIHGIIYLGGKIGNLRGRKVDLRKEKEIVIEMVRRLPRVRDVLWDAELVE